MTEIEKNLQEFLAWERKNRSEGKTVEALLEKQDKMMTALRRAVKDRLEDKEVSHRHGRAIKTLQHQVGMLTDAVPQVPGWRPPTEEQTGQHDVVNLQLALEKQAALEERLDRDEERRVEEETWWRRQRWVWAGIATAALLGTALTGCVAYMSKKLDAIERVVNEKPAPAPPGR